jgi:hypothetical protein
MARDNGGKEAQSGFEEEGRVEREGRSAELRIER